MAFRKGGRKVYRTMQGKQIDMDMLRKKHELTPAVGNARVNARGDQLGPGGKIIRKREDVVKDYYKNSPGSVLDQDAVPSKAPQQEPVLESKPTRAQAKVEEEWVEDEDGNFLPKNA